MEEADVEPAAEPEPEDEGEEVNKAWVELVKELDLELAGSELERAKAEHARELVQKDAELAERGRARDEALAEVARLRARLGDPPEGVP